MWFWFVAGITVGWIVEWIVDWVFWRSELRQSGYTELRLQRQLDTTNQQLAAYAKRIEELEACIQEVEDGNEASPAAFTVPLESKPMT